MNSDQGTPRTDRGWSNLSNNANKIIQQLRDKQTVKTQNEKMHAGPLFPSLQKMHKGQSGTGASQNTKDKLPAAKWESDAGHQKNEDPLWGSSNPESRLKLPPVSSQPTALCPLHAFDDDSLPETGRVDAMVQPGLLSRTKYWSCISWKCPKYAVYRKAERIHDLYQVTGELGVGGFARVYSARNRETDKEYAIKLMKNQIFRKHQALIEVEVQVLAGFNHPHLVALHEVVQTNNFLVLVTELVRGGELFDHIAKIQKFTEDVARDIFSQVLEAVQVLHEAGIVHRDLKPENILVEHNGEDNFHIKVADFGLASFYDDSSALCKGVGTPEYSAPEVILCLPHSFPCDIWSLGVVLYILLCGMFPFFGKDEASLKDSVVKGVYYFAPTHWSSVSDDAKDLITSMLQVNPLKRPTIHQLQKHPWLRKDQTSGGSALPLDELRRFNATRKFRRSVFAIIVAQRLASRVAEADDNLSETQKLTTRWLLQHAGHTRQLNHITENNSHLKATPTSSPLITSSPQSTSGRKSLQQTRPVNVRAVVSKEGSPKIPSAQIPKRSPTRSQPQQTTHHSSPKAEIRFAAAPDFKTNVFRGRAGSVNTSTPELQIQSPAPHKHAIANPRVRSPSMNTIAHSKPGIVSSSPTLTHLNTRSPAALKRLSKQ